jgi:RNA polymerase sigma-70 factor (ECF subfamily)
MGNLTGQAAEGEDLAQEVFLRLYQGRPKYQQEGIAHGRALLYTMARRLAYQYAAYRKRWKRLADQQAPIRDALLGAGPSTPEELLELAETGVYLQEALDGVPEPQREILLLRHREDLSYAEMAEVLQCSIPQVKSRLHYARHLLRARLLQLRLFTDR